MRRVSDVSNLQERERERERRNQAEEAAREASKALGTNTNDKHAMAANYEGLYSVFERRAKDKKNITYDSVPWPAIGRLC